MPSMTQDANSDREMVRMRKREYYRLHLDRERHQARLRAERHRGRTKQSLKMQSDEDIARRRESHRLAQARYREANRLKLKTDAWQYRLRVKHEKQRRRDEEEYRALWSAELDTDGA
ncbi:hypothetical protein BDZ97DRAFT_1766013 [Flammula alnicola]|nr:hypothetical protein BDZ97DRAFT_1766013 [Flammula alnicola]